MVVTTIIMEVGRATKREEMGSEEGMIVNLVVVVMVVVVEEEEEVIKSLSSRQPLPKMLQNCIHRGRRKNKWK